MNNESDVGNLVYFKTLISNYHPLEKIECDESYLQNQREVFLLLDVLNKDAYQEIDKKFFNDDWKKEK